VVDFQPLYTFNKRHIDDLRIGTDILREAVKLDTEKNDRLTRARAEEKAAQEAVKRNVRLILSQSGTSLTCVYRLVHNRS
jgi:phage host-nuclease inhibitor protein Gam